MLDLWCAVLEKFVFIFNEIMNLLFELKTEWNCFYIKINKVMVNKDVYLILILVVLSVIITFKLLKSIPEKYFQLPSIDVNYLNIERRVINFIFHCFLFIHY